VPVPVPVPVPATGVISHKKEPPVRLFFILPVKGNISPDRLSHPP
jgi:hypothetical protein